MKKTDEKSTFDILSAINVKDKIDKKGQFSYLSWAWAWEELQKNFPNSTRKVYRTQDELSYFRSGTGAEVRVGITIDSVEHISELPIMDFKNQSIPYEKVDAMNINKAIQRATVKAIALHGLGLYIYAGEDLPEEQKEEPKKPVALPKMTAEQKEKYSKWIIDQIDKGVEINDCIATIATRHTLTKTDLEDLKKVQDQWFEKHNAECAKLVEENKLPEADLPKESQKMISKAQITAIEAIKVLQQVSDEDFSKLLVGFGTEDLNTLNEIEAEALIKNLSKQK